ncbi:unnamed protein product [Moneuplotes crassus]|uniref:non-specific serine/threonine protein kinase n=1 Tax=Euplotes crassus TaxID=5936 RepID=A0AAD1U9M5_EUPCR|nr:unnamed protein product [Moneuplotes crassus]
MTCTKVPFVHAKLATLVILLTTIFLLLVSINQGWAGPAQPRRRDRERKRGRMSSIMNYRGRVGDVEGVEDVLVQGMKCRNYGIKEVRRGEGISSGLCLASALMNHEKKYFRAELPYRTLPNSPDVEFTNENTDSIPAFQPWLEIAKFAKNFDLLITDALKIFFPIQPVRGAMMHESLTEDNDLEETNSEASNYSDSFMNPLESSSVGLGPNSLSSKIIDGKEVNYSEKERIQAYTQWIRHLNLDLLTKETCDYFPYDIKVDANRVATFIKIKPVRALTGHEERRAKDVRQTSVMLDLNALIEAGSVIMTEFENPVFMAIVNRNITVINLHEISEIPSLSNHEQKDNPNSIENREYSLLGVTVPDGDVFLNMSLPEFSETETFPKISSNFQMYGSEKEDILLGHRSGIHGLENTKYTKILELMTKSEGILNWIDDYSTYILVGLFVYAGLALLPCIYFVFHNSDEQKIKIVQTSLTNSGPINIPKLLMRKQSVQEGSRARIKVPEIHKDCKSSRPIQLHKDLLSSSSNRLPRLMTLEKPSPFGFITKKVKNYPTKEKILEEPPSSSVSPASSFKKKRDTFATSKHRYVVEDYYYSGNKIIVNEVLKKTITLKNTPMMQRILSTHFAHKTSELPIAHKAVSFKIKRAINLVPIQETFTEEKSGLKKHHKYKLRTMTKKKSLNEDNEYFDVQTINNPPKPESGNEIDKELSQTLKSKVNTSLNEYDKQFIHSDSPIKGFGGSFKQPLARVIKYQKKDFLINEIQERCVVQNSDEIAHEDKLINELRNYTPRKKPNKIAGHQSSTLIEAKLNRAKSSENGKVMEISNPQNAQNFHSSLGCTHYEKRKEPIYPSHIQEAEATISDCRNLSKIIFEDQEEDKDIINELESLSVSEEDTQSQIFNEEGKYQLNNQNICIEDFVPKTSPLYKHLECGKTSSLIYMDSLGKGGFGSVVKAKHILDNNIYAIKKIKLHLGIDQDIREHKVFREVQAMTIVNHPNVVRYYTSWLELAPQEEQQLERKKMLKRYRKCHHPFLSHVTKKEKSRNEEIQETDENNSTSSPYGRKPSSDSDSDSGIQWEENNESSEFAHEKDIFSQPESEQPLSKANGKKGEFYSSTNKASIPQKCLYDDSEISSDDASSNESSLSLESIADLTTCFKCIELKKDFVTCNLRIQMEICLGHSLKEFLTSRNNSGQDIDRKVNLRFFKQITEGIRHVHQQGIIHRDLKPANVFISNTQEIKIGDFGLARAFDPDSSKGFANMISSKRFSMKKINFQKSSLSLKVGTPMYLSPEQEEGKDYDEKVDVFAIGLILFELCNKLVTNHQKIEGFQNLKKGILPSELMKNMAPESQLLLKLTNADPALRPSVREILRCQEYKQWRQEVCGHSSFDELDFA